MSYSSAFRGNVSSPGAMEPMGTCMRCAFEYPLRLIAEQEEWRGTQIMGTGVWVCPRCTDTPNETLRTIILPPDPEPIEHPLPAEGIN